MANEAGFSPLKIFDINELVSLSEYVKAKRNSTQKQINIVVRDILRMPVTTVDGGMITEVVTTVDLSKPFIELLKDGGFQYEVDLESETMTISWTDAAKELGSDHSGVGFKSDNFNGQQKLASIFVSLNYDIFTAENIALMMYTKRRLDNLVTNDQKQLILDRCFGMAQTGKTEVKVPLSDLKDTLGDGFINLMQLFALHGLEVEYDVEMDDIHFIWG